MTNYSDDPERCRVDFFKPSGKWYSTHTVTFKYDAPDIHAGFRTALNIAIGNTLIGMQAICLEPYHKFSHPISLIWEGAS